MLVSELFESQQLSDLEMKAVVDAFKENCIGFDINGPQLYRRGSELGISKTRERRVKSFGGSEKIWQWMYQSIPQWKEYPDRTKSIFCASNPNSIMFAANGSNTNIIIPFNGTKLAYSKIDFNALKIYGRYLTGIQSLVTDAIPRDKEDPQNFKGMLELANQYYQQLEWLQGEDTQRMVNEYPKMFLPKRLDIHLETSPAQPSGDFNEIWFEGSYLAIPLSQWTQFKQLV